MDRRATSAWRTTCRHSGSDGGASLLGCLVSYHPRSQVPNSLALAAVNSSSVSTPC
jgi:hypothetical protein